MKVNNNNNNNKHKNYSYHIILRSLSLVRSLPRTLQAAYIRSYGYMG